MKPETAARAVALLDEHGWWDGQELSDLHGPRICLGRAIVRTVEHELAVGLGWKGVAEIREARDVIRRLFPGRAAEIDDAGMEVAYFNDHPDTTESDVRLILKHMTEETS